MVDNSAAPAPDTAHRSDLPSGTVAFLFGGHPLSSGVRDLGSYRRAHDPAPGVCRPSSSWSRRRNGRGSRRASEYLRLLHRRVRYSRSRCRTRATAVARPQAAGSSTLVPGERCALAFTHRDDTRRRLIWTSPQTGQQTLRALRITISADRSRLTLALDGPYYA